MKTNYWKTKEGRYLFIPDMSNEHIENCIKLVESNYLRYKEGVKFCNDKNQSFSSIDEHYYIEELLTIEERYPVYSQLKKEYETRK